MVSPVLVITYTYAVFLTTYNTMVSTDNPKTKLKQGEEKKEYISSELCYQCSTLSATFNSMRRDNERQWLSSYFGKTKKNIPYFLFEISEPFNALQ